LPPPPELSPAPESDAVRKEAPATRPDIAAVEQRAKAQQARAERAERERYPDLTLSTSYNSMWDMPAHRWMVGLSLDLPLQIGVRAGAAEEARAMGAQLEQQAARLRDVARTQVFVARKQLAESAHVLGLYETRLLPIAKQRIEAARAGFVTSQNPFTVVIDAERALRALELEYQKARAEQVARRAELERALGNVPGLDSQAGGP
jgi:outer membrane protein TolC